MKPSAPDRPRFSCRAARNLLAVFGRTDGGHPRGLGAGHVAGCPDCQEFFGACDELELALSRDALQQTAPFPAGLEQRIIHAVERSARAPRAARPASTLTLIALAGAAACAAIAFLVVQKSPVLKSDGSGLVAVIDSTREALTSRTLPDRLLNSLSPATTTLLAGGDPLQTEVEAVKSDARSALQFLALNFLPVSPDFLANGASRSPVSGG